MISQKKIINILNNLKIKKNDNLFIHCDLGLIKTYKNRRDLNKMCQTLFNALKKVVGKNGTIAVPTFTYSFAKNKSYDCNLSVSECGFFSEFIRKKKNVLRYNDPNVSVSVYGKNSFFLTDNPQYFSYGFDSFFDRFVKLGGKICNINMDAGSTFIHYFEKKYQAKYRKEKVFSGNIIIKKKKYKKTFSLYVRRRKNAYFANFNNFHNFAVKYKKFKTSIFGRGFIGVISLKDMEKTVKLKLEKDNKFFVF